MRGALLLLCLICARSAGQEVFADRVKGLRLNGSFKSKVPITLVDAKPITVAFDVTDAKPEEFRIKIFHCDKNWKVTQSSFINDEFHNVSKSTIPYRQAPAGVKEYTFTYFFRVPGFPGLERFPASGNYVLEVWNAEPNTLLARGRFFVVEGVIDTAMRVSNRYLPSQTSPANQVNKIEVAYPIPQGKMSGLEKILPQFVTTCAVYRNRELYFPRTIDVDDRYEHTFVKGLGTDELTFLVDDVLPGNEYRTIDLRDVNFYPPGQSLRARDGADVSRYLHEGSPDNDGTSTLVLGNRYADYVSYGFELVVDNDPRDDLFVLGDFNCWMPSEPWKLHFDRNRGRYALTASLRRGVYDYEYAHCAAGSIPAKADPFDLEGNDWRTVNVYTAFVYYHDIRLGGYDRIVQCSQALSPGGTEPTSE